MLLTIGFSLPSKLHAYGPPLVEAALRNDFAEAVKLLNQGEDPNLAGFDGTTALMHATRHQNFEMVRSLLDKGARTSTMDPKKHPLLTYGSITDPRIVSLFLDRGLPVDTSDSNGNTLQMLAARNGVTQVVQLLASRGANVNAKDKMGMTALHLAVANHGRASTVSDLLRLGAEVNSSSSDGTTPLMGASRVGRADMIKLLAENGAHINALNERGETALMFAARTGRTAAVQVLLSYGAMVTPKRKTDGATALSFAEGTGINQVIDLLRAAHARQ